MNIKVCQFHILYDITEDFFRLGEKVVLLQSQNSAISRLANNSTFPLEPTVTTQSATVFQRLFAKSGGNKEVSYAQPRSLMVAMLGNIYQGHA